jgi:hypothetical protein
MIKIRKHIQFNESNHTYTHLTTGENYMSVTKFISRFHEKFDSDKIAQNLINNIPKYKLRFKEVPIEEATGILKSEWDKRRDIGIFIHGILERYIKGETVFSEIKSKLWNERIAQLISAYDKLQIKHNNQGYEQCPEMIVYNDEFKLAGQADLILLNHEEKKIKIFDHKTNQNGITYKAYRNKKMFPPLEYMPDCNYNHYTLQLSLYAYFLEIELGYKCEELNILWIDTNNPHHVNIEVINLDYRLTEINLLLNHYKTTETPLCG